MDLSKEAINELKEIYQKEFCKEIDDQEAKNIGTKLLRLYSLFTKYRSLEDGV